MKTRVGTFIEDVLGNGTFYASPCQLLGLYQRWIDLGEPTSEKHANHQMFWSEVTQTIGGF